MKRVQFVALFLLHLVQSLLTKEAQLLQWINDHGGHSSKVGFVFKEGRRYLVARENLDEGDIVSVTPVGLSMNNAAALAVPEIRDVVERHVEAKYRFLPLALLLLHELQKGETSQWKPYLDFLPTEGVGALFWTQSETKLFKGAVNSALYHLQEEFVAIYEAIEWACSNHSVLFPQSCPTPDEVRWTVATLWSRVFKGGTNGYGLEDSFSLLPIVDAANHAPRAFNPLKLEAVESSQHPGPHAFHTIAQKAHKAGDELFYSYGTTCNEKLLSIYGFVLPDGHHDCFSFSLVKEAAELCWPAALVAKESDLLLFRTITVNHPVPLGVARFFWLAAFNSCDPSLIVELNMSIADVAKKENVGSNARLLWKLALLKMKAELQTKMLRGPFDTTTVHGMMQVLKQSQMRAIQWHLQWIEVAIVTNGAWFSASEDGLDVMGEGAAHEVLRSMVGCIDDPQHMADCKGWAARGDCQDYIALSNYCCRSCQKTLQPPKFGNRIHRKQVYVVSDKSSKPPAHCRDSADWGAKCKIWALSDECEENHDWMKGNCCSSCWMTGQGRSADPPGSQLVRDRSLQRLFPPFRYQLTVSDKSSKPPAHCRDSADWGAKCKIWALSDECEENHDWMKENCCSSCWMTGQGRSADPAGSLMTPSVVDEPTAAPSMAKLDSLKQCVNNPKYETKCETWKKVGACKKQFAFMGKWCCASCWNNTAPQGTQQCADLHQICGWWTSKGGCTSKIDGAWMHTYCCASCQGLRL